MLPVRPDWKRFTLVVCAHDACLHVTSEQPYAHTCFHQDSAIGRKILKILVQVFWVTNQFFKFTCNPYPLESYQDRDHELVTCWRPLFQWQWGLTLTHPNTQSTLSQDDAPYWKHKSGVVFLTFYSMFWRTSSGGNKSPWPGSHVVKHHESSTRWRWLMHFWAAPNAVTI